MNFPKSFAAFRLAIFWLLASLIAAQSLGLVHRTLHAPFTAAAGSGDDSKKLFGHEENAQDCAAFDALSSVDGPLFSLPTIVAAFVPATLSFPVLSIRLGQPLGLASARGPPAYS